MFSNANGPKKHHKNYFARYLATTLVSKYSCGKKPGHSAHQAGGDEACRVLK
jgi:hypothetical protein